MMSFAEVLKLIGTVTVIKNEVQSLSTSKLRV